MSEFIFPTTFIPLAALLKSPEHPKPIHSSGHGGRDREGGTRVTHLIRAARVRVPTAGPVLSSGLHPGCSWGTGPDQKGVSALQRKWLPLTGKGEGAGGGAPGSSQGLGLSGLTGRASAASHH